MFIFVDVKFKFIIINGYFFFCECSCKIKFNYFVVGNFFYSVKGWLVVDLLYDFDDFIGI